MRRFLWRGNSKSFLPGSSLQDKCTGQKKEQPWVPPPSDNQSPRCDTGGTPLRLSCSGRRQPHRPPRFRPKFDNLRYFPRLQDWARLALREMFGFKEMFWTQHHTSTLTYPLSRVDTVVSHIGVAGFVTLRAVAPVDRSGKRTTVLVGQYEYIDIQNKIQKLNSHAGSR